MQGTTLTVVEPDERRLSELLRGAGIKVDAFVPIHGEVTPQVTTTPAVIVADLRGESTLPGSLGALRRAYTRAGVVIVTSAADPQLLIEAMRAGITECVPEPFSADDLRGAIERITGAQVAPVEASRVIAFVGAKGGVGTTTVAVNTAFSIAARDPGNVAVVDLHLGGHGDVALLLGLEPRFSVADALDNTDHLDSAYLKTLVARTKGGLDVLASPNRPLARPPDADSIHILLKRLTERYSTVVLDVPRDAFGLLDSLDPLSSVTVVINQELPSVRRAVQVVGLLRQRYGRERVSAVVNRYDAKADIGQEDIERVVATPLLATLPSDYKKAVEAVNSGIPFASENHSKLSSAIEALARRLSGKESTPKADKTAKSKRMFGLF